MKILFLYLFPLWGNGSGSFLRELALELNGKGHQIAIVAPDKRKLPGITHYVVNAPQHGVFVGHPELPNAKKWEEMNAREFSDIYISYLKCSIAAVSDFKPDVIHVFHTAFLPEVGRMIKALFGIKYLITTHGSDLSYLVKDRRCIPLISDANRSARFITANSDFTKKWYLKMFGNEIKRKTSVIVGGVNMKHYKKDPQMIEQINKKYNLRDHKVVLFTGRLTKHKGVIYLIQAAKYINNAVILIVGDGPERKTIEEKIKELGLPNIVMAGYMNTTNPLFHALYERADVYVAPSVWEEPLGLTILEAMAAHMPVVATRKGGVVSIIHEGENGFLVNARSSRQIADAVNLLLADESLRQKIGEAAYKTVSEKFSWETIAKAFEKLYDQMKKKEQVEERIPLDDFFKRLLLLE